MQLYLNLDPDFKPFMGKEISFEKFIFSGGEPHLKIDPTLILNAANPCITITNRLNSFTDLGFLCLAVDALKRLYITNIQAFIPYFPAARQDRVMIQGEPLSVKVYADIINSLGFSKIQIFDPHSEVAPALLNNCEVITNYYFIQNIIAYLQHKPQYLIAPDGGALKKIYKLANFLNNNIEVIECSKTRNVKTGQLTDFKVNTDNLQNKNCLIVDDICDGGATFIGLAQALKNKSAGNLFLAVSHGIFSKGFEQLGNYFTQIFTTNSIKNFNHPLLTQFNFNHGLLP